jgi:Phosphotransferase enzyme family
VSVGSFLADPAFPQLKIATDPALMKQTFRTHLRPVGPKVYDIEDCRFIRLRYRQGSRCFLQYTLRLVEPDTGRQREVQVTGLIYAQKDKAEQAWRKLKATDPRLEIPDAWLTFEPVSFVAELDMLVQVFPYDHRLPTLPVLAAGPPPELEPVLLGRFGAGDWRVQAWKVEPVRYLERGVVLRYTARARNAATGGTREKSFYAKVYRHKKGEQTYQALRVLWSQDGAREGFSVVRPLAYLRDLRALILEEAAGTPLDEILLRERDSTEAVRRVAKALAAFNQGDAPATTQPHLLADEVAVLERGRRVLGWACPHLRPEVESIIAGVLAGLEEVSLRPTHRDLSPDHIFVDGERTIFIDLDSLAKADPVLDPAYLLTRLAMPALFPIPRQQARTATSRQRARTAAWEFAEEYFAHVPRTWHERLPFHYAGTLLKVAQGFFRRQAPDWPERIATLLEEAKASLVGRVW